MYYGFLILCLVLLIWTMKRNNKIKKYATKIKMEIIDEQERYINVGKESVKAGYKYTVNFEHKGQTITEKFVTTLKYNVGQKISGYYVETKNKKYVSLDVDVNATSGLVMSVAIVTIVFFMLIPVCLLFGVDCLLTLFAATVGYGFIAMYIDGRNKMKKKIQSPYSYHILLWKEFNSAENLSLRRYDSRTGNKIRRRD